MALAYTKKQDGFLPIASVSRIMKKSLPANAKISKEVKHTVQECVSEFINFVTGESIGYMSKITSTSIGNYVGPLKDYINKYRESAEGEKNNVATKEDASSPNNGHGEKIEDISVVHNNLIVSTGFAASHDDHDLWEFKTFSSNYLGIGLPDDSRSTHRREIDYCEQMNVVMISNAENGKSYAFDEHYKRVMASIVEHRFEW